MKNKKKKGDKMTKLGEKPRVVFAVGGTIAIQR